MKRRFQGVDKAAVSCSISRMKLAEIPELKTASPEEKIELIDELWASIPRESLASPQSHLKELNQRVAAVQKDASRALTPEEARQRIRAKTGL
jgi:putative addiction module component (TIGR02574 family)